MLATIDMKTTKLTPWQQWAQEYQSKIPTFLRREPEYVNEYSRAAWEECKKRCLQAIKKQRIEWDEWDDPYITDEATREIKNL